MAKPSIYAVARGRACGLFTSWQECEKQIKGYPGARYKGFADVAAALAWLNGETNAATGAPQGSARRAPS
ncbi:MAG: viroplasmin family protein, partial [Selenomonadaceae bacterium]|nr:viroplasmin family protein [Selenomonadaceae bacterium]